MSARQLARAAAAIVVAVWQRTPRPREIAESLAYARRRRGHARRRWRPGWRPAPVAAATAAAVAVLVAGGLLLGQLGGGTGRPAARPARPSAPRPAPLPVQVGAGAAGQPGARQVAVFLGAYYGAIRAGDYPAYTRLFLPAAALPAPGLFSAAARHSYQGVTLDGLMTAAGTAVAQVTFASRPASGRPQGPARDCTANFALYRQRGAYVLEAAPYGPSGPDVTCGL